MNPSGCGRRPDVSQLYLSISEEIKSACLSERQVSVREFFPHVGLHNHDLSKAIQMAIQMAIRVAIQCEVLPQLYVEVFRCCDSVD